MLAASFTLIAMLIFGSQTTGLRIIAAGAQENDDASTQKFVNETILAERAGGDIEIAAEDNNIYVLWPNEGKLLLRKSLDNGRTFDPQLEVASGIEIPLEYQMAVSGKNVYVAWIDGAYDNPSSRGVFFAKSTDAGASFSKPVNLSTNRIDSPAVYFSNLGLAATTGDKVHVIWIMSDYSWGQIYHVGSTNSGNTFSTPQDVSKIPATDPQVYTNYVKMSASGDNVYVAWQQYDESKTGNNEQGSVHFTKSNDAGKSFDSGRIFSQKGTTPQPQVVSRGNVVCLTWYDDSGISFKRSQDSGRTFDDTLVLTKDFGYPEISLPAGNTDNVYITYMYWPIWDVQLIRSTDSGKSFAGPMTLTNNTLRASPYSFFTPSILSESDHVFILFPKLIEGEGDHMSLLVSSNGGEDFDAAYDLTELLGASGNYKAAASLSGLHLAWIDDSASITYVQYPDPSPPSSEEHNGAATDENTDFLPALIGIGAAMAGIAAYFTLRKRK